MNTFSFCPNCGNRLDTTDAFCKHCGNAVSPNGVPNNDCNIKKVYASHLKAKVSDEQYFNIFPKNKDITLIKMGNSYEIL